MIRGSKWDGLGLMAVVIGAGILIGLIWFSCSPPDRTTAHAKADTLVTDSVPRWQAQRDSFYQALTEEQRDADQARLEAQLERRKRLAVQRRADSLERVRQSLTDTLNAVRESPLPYNASASDSVAWWRNVAERQHLVIGSLEEEVRALRQGSEGYEREIKLNAEEALRLRRLSDGLRDQLATAHNRIDVLAGALDTLNQSTKSGIDLGLFRVPEWADEAVLVVAAGYAGCKVGGGC